MTDNILKNFEDIGPSAIILDNGDVIFAESNISFESEVIMLINPIRVHYFATPEGEVTTSSPYMPYSSQDTFPIPLYKILSYSPLDEFFKRFYGSSLLRFSVQRAKRLLSIDGETKENLKTLYDQLKIRKDEIANKFGFLDVNEDEDGEDYIEEIIKNDRRVLH